MYCAVPFSLIKIKYSSFVKTPRQPEIRIRFGCGGRKKARFCCASELQELQRFLNSEVQSRAQGEIESALAGIKIIIETIAPWKSSPVSLAPPTSARAVRVGPGSK
jgi:hypothetical protein